MRRAAVAAYEKLGAHDDLADVKSMLNDHDADVRRAAVAVYEKLGDESDLMDISAIYAKGEIVNHGLLACIIVMDEKFYSQSL